MTFDGLFRQKLKIILGCLMIPASAYSAGDLVIRGDQPTSIIAEIPLDPKIPPVWLMDDSGLSADEQMKKLFADIELFTKPPESGENLNQEFNSNFENTFKEVKGGVQP